MKNILFALLMAGLYSAANAGSTNSALALNGTVNSACNSTFSQGTLNFTLVPGSTPASQGTTYTLTCTAGSVISAFTATSANGWNLTGTTAGDLIPYGIGSSTAAPYAAGVANTWSNVPGTTTATNLLASGSITINGAADPIVSTLTIGVSTVPQASNTDSYSDTVTVATAY